MFSSFLQGFLLGVGAAVPLGPINILIMNRALKSYTLAVATGLGALSADLCYILLLTLGLGSFLQESILLKILGFFGSAFLIYLAYSVFAKRDESIYELKRDVLKGRMLRTYISGYLLTLLNPYTIAFWTSVSYIIDRTKHRLSQSFYSKVSLIAAFILFGFGVYLLYVTIAMILE
ncbi:MAG: LysE family transporter [Sulfurovaceae bacterium]